MKGSQRQEHRFQKTTEVRQIVAGSDSLKEGPLGPPVSNCEGEA